MYYITNKEWQCIICSGTFKDPGDYKYHLTVHELEYEIQNVEYSLQAKKAELQA